MNMIWARMLVTVVALAVLALVVFRGEEIDGAAVALVVVAVLPWLQPVFENIDFPGGGGVRFKDLQAKVDAQQEIVNQLVVYSIAWYIFELLSKLYHLSRSGGEYLFRDNEAMKRDLRFLRDHGFLEHFIIQDLRDGENLIGKIKLTPVGNFAVEIREQLQGKQSAKAAKQLA